MAEKLLKLYKFAQDVGGAQAKVRLAMATKMPSVRAATEPDSRENVEMLRNAIKELLGKEAPPV
jgi:hypothetical protein